MPDAAGRYKVELDLNISNKFARVKFNPLLKHLQNVELKLNEDLHLFRHLPLTPAPATDGEKQWFQTFTEGVAFNGVRYNKWLQASVDPSKWTVAVSAKTLETDAKYKFAFDLVADGWLNAKLSVGGTYSSD